MTKVILLLQIIFKESDIFNTMHLRVICIISVMSLLNQNIYVMSQLFLF